MPPKGKALKIEEFNPLDDILENATKWKSWRRKLEIQMEYFGISNANEKKMCLLVHGGDCILSIDENATEPEGEADVYSKLIQKIEAVYIPTKNRLHSRFRFNNATRETHQTISQYELELRRLAKDCEFHVIHNESIISYEDEMILDHLILTCGDDKIQKEALTKDWNLKDFLKNATTKQDVKAQTDEMNIEVKHESKDDIVKRITSDNPSFQKRRKGKIYSFKNSQNPNYVHEQKSELCTRCGYKSNHVTCPAMGKACHLCGKLNHFSSCCRTKLKETKAKAIQRDDLPETISEPEIDIESVRRKLNIRLIKGKDSSNILLPVEICGIQMKIDPDTGADVDLISKDDFQKIYSQNPDVEKLIDVPKDKIRALGGAQLGIICILKDASFSNRTVKNVVRDIYVIENGIHDYPLLSEKTLLDLGMVKYSPDGMFACEENNSVKKVESQVQQNDEKGRTDMENIVNSHKKLFEGIGKLRNPNTGEPILSHIEMNTDAKPVIQPARPVPHHLSERTKKKLDYFVDQGIMSWTEPGEPLTYVSPLVISPKSSDPNADVRITADFRLANKGASRTRIVPGVRVDDLSVTFAGCKIFSKLDMNNGYHQFGIDEESKKYLVVTTPWGNLKHNTLAQGWITSQDEFDRRMDDILMGIPKVKNNRDDCLIGGENWEEHNRNLNTVLSSLESHGLTINKDKCEFGKKEIDFYGIRFSEEGLKPSPKKINALKECGEPTSKEGVRSFLQMIGYMSRFIPNFSQIAAPLRELTKTETKFVWEKDQQLAFDKLKQSITEETSLAFFIPNRPTRLYVDAGKKMEKSSNVPGGLCAILTQENEEGEWKMCHVANRSLTKVETKYGQTELEAVAIKWACTDALYQYLTGAPKFEIYTDCKPLEHLFNNPKSKAPIRIERQILAIQGLHYVVKYNKGKENIADYGSRHITKEPEDKIIRNVKEFEEEITGFLFEPNSKSDKVILQRAEEDSNYQFLKFVIENNLWKKHGKDQRISRYLGVAPELTIVKGLIFFKDTLVPPFIMQQTFVSEAHKIGHSGEKRTVDLLRERIWFPGMIKMAKDIVKSCFSCQMTYDRTYDEPLQSTPFPPHVWHTISVDFKGPFKDGYYALVGYDLYSRYPVLEYCKSTSFSATKYIFDSWFATYGIVNTLKSDNGPPFNGHMFNEYANEKGFEHKPIAPRHPRGNGESERFMQNLNKAARIAEEEGVNYRNKINGMLEAYRATPHPATGKSPYELMFGRKMNLKIFPNIRRNNEDREIREQDKMYKQKAKIYHDRRRNVKKSPIQIGDKVLMKNKRTDRLNTDIGTVIQVKGNTVTAEFDNRKVFKRNKSHFKIINITQPTKRATQKNYVISEEKKYAVWTPSDSEEDSETEVEEVSETEPGENSESELPVIQLTEQSQCYITRRGRTVKEPKRYGEWTL